MLTRLFLGGRLTSGSRTPLVAGGVLCAVVLAAILPAPARAAGSACTPPVTNTTVVNLGGRHYNPSDAGKPVTFDASVDPSPCTAIPTGTITFKDTLNGGTQTTLGTGALVAASSSFVESGLAPGSHSIVAVYGGDSNYAPSSSAAYVEPIQTVPTWWVEQAYFDTLGRAADSTGESYWVGQLAHHSSTEVALALLRSAEGRSLAVSNAFVEVLGRQPDPGGLGAYSKALQAGGRDESMIAALAASAEFFAAGGGSATPTDATWIEALYARLLHRSADPGGEAHWLAAIAAGATRSSVAEAFAFGRERLALLVAGPGGAGRWYELALHRSADPGGLDFHLGLLVDGSTDEQVLSRLIGSPEYLARNNVVSG